MKHGLLKSILFLSMTSAGSVLLGRGIINTFTYDIFDKCVTNPDAATDYMCRNASDLIQVMIYGLATVIFMGVLFVFTKEIGRKKAAIRSFLLGVVFFGLLIGSWRLILDLQDNFINLFALQNGVPKTFTEYVFSLYNRLNDVLVGVVLGFMIWIPGAVNKYAKSRPEPRIKFVKGGLPTEDVSKKAEAKKEIKKTATKKTAAKKPATKSVAAKKTTAKKKTTTKK